MGSIIYVKSNNYVQNHGEDIGIYSHSKVAICNIFAAYFVLLRYFLVFTLKMGFIFGFCSKKTSRKSEFCAKTSIGLANFGKWTKNVYSKTYLDVYHTTKNYV